MSWISYTYGVNQRDLAEINSKLASVGENVPRAVRNALNRTATKTRRNIISRVRSVYAYKGLKIGDMKLVRASPDRLQALLKAQGPTHTMIKFKWSAPKKGAKAAELKGPLKPLVGRGGKAFRFDETIAQRVGPERLPLRVPRGSSVPKMIEQVFTGKRGGGDMSKEVGETLHKELQAEIQKVIQ